MPLGEALESSAEPGAIAAGSIKEDDLYALVRHSFPYATLPRSEFDTLVELLSEGIATGRGRRSAHLHRDRVNGVLRARRGARIAAITSGGAIPDVADYDVIEEPAGTLVGRVHEDFAVESMGGDIFLLGNNSWRIRRVEAGRVRVEDAHGAPPTIPFWLGEAPARSAELSGAVSDVRDEVAQRLQRGGVDAREDAIAWLEVECGLPRAGGEQVVDYLAATLRILGVAPTQQTIVAERFFDESGGMQLVLHTPFGGRINRAWGLALRKRFCVTFDFELQAAATDDGIVISLGEQHSFPLDSVFSMVRLPTLQADLTQAAMASPMFTNRWRWNASRALALLRFEGGRRVPMPIQRMRAEDLLAAVFPDQIACQDNRTGPIVPPDHPLVNETLENCLTEAMDIDGLRAILEAIERREIRTVAVETPLPSLMSHEILNANPYAFLDNAPLEERRARAVALRRVDPDLAGGVGALDAEAIAVVRSQAWPDVRDADELHDALLSFGLLPVRYLDEWEGFADQLIAARRATIARWEGPEAPTQALVAAERLQLAEAVCGPLTLNPAVAVPDGIPPVDSDDGAREVVRGWLEASGPITAAALADGLGLGLGTINMALAALEGSGAVLRGSFTHESTSGEIEWCDRRLLARIHRLTLGRLRQEIEPVATTDFLRFLFRWQHLAPGTQLHARDGLAEVVGQLQGLELPAPAWEGAVLPGRVARYDPSELEQLCLAGHVAWGRLTFKDADKDAELVDSGPRRSGGARRGERTIRGAIVVTPDGHVTAPAAPGTGRKARTAPSRQAPLAFVLREDLATFLADGVQGVAEGAAPSATLSASAREVVDYLAQRGASFMGDIARGTGRLAAEVEDALWELVARGLVTGDGIAGLRILLQPEDKRRTAGRHLRALRGGKGPSRLLPVGRWSLWGQVPEEPVPESERADRFARQLLRRYGVVFRDLIARESQAPPWRVLLGVYRRMEARGEIRGGRFVGGYVGEQYALPEAVDALRTLRRQRPDGEVVLVHCGDPLNLIGILTPGARVSPYSNQVIAFRDGSPIETGPLGAVQSRLQFAATGAVAAR